MAFALLPSRSPDELYEPSATGIAGDVGPVGRTGNMRADSGDLGCAFAASVKPPSNTVIASAGCIIFTLISMIVFPLRGFSIK
jgi:hypothetical protein